MRRRRMRLPALALLLAAAALFGAEPSGQAPPGDEARQASAQDPPEPAGEGQAPGGGEADFPGAQASEEDPAGEAEEASLESIELQGSIQSNANVNLPQDI